ncbi:hypothetical protein [Colwellia sp. TT2012]|nr:hypothetical protein [Colwellia sp. TT2012]
MDFKVDIIHHDGVYSVTGSYQLNINNASSVLPSFITPSCY